MKQHSNIGLVPNTKGLDGTLLDVDRNTNLYAPNKNEYFLCFIFIALALAAIGYGTYKFFNADKYSLDKNEAYVFWGIGIPFFIGGLVCVIKAFKCLMGQKKFLQGAKFTKCNVQCKIEVEMGSTRGINGEREGYYKIHHTLRVDYFDDKNQHHSKIVKYLPARKYYEKMNSFFVLEGECMLMEDYGLVAYNQKGRIVLPYIWQIDGQIFGNTFAVKRFVYK